MPGSAGQPRKQRTLLRQIIRAALSGGVPDELMLTEAGQLYRRVSRIEFALSKGIPLEVDAEEFNVLLVIESERQRHYEEQSKPKTPVRMSPID